MHLDVRLHGASVGVIENRGDRASRFYFRDEYIDSADRSVLGLHFEQDLRKAHVSDRGLPVWFENLLPEGSLLQLIEQQLQSDYGRRPSDVEIIAQVGEDLPGAVTVHPLEETVPVRERYPLAAQAGALPSLGTRLNFSVPGVGLKFSVLRRDEKFVAPASGQDGDWLLKLPDPVFRLLPQNEWASMRLASRVGIDTPEVQLLNRDELSNVPERFWRSEQTAIAVRRFDRVDGGRVHMEDFAQVRNFEVDDRYEGNFETLAGLIWRRTNESDLHEFVRRLTLNLVIGNDDAHLKNWSILYRDSRTPALSPVYDVVSVEAYPVGGMQRGTGLKLHNSRRYEDVTGAAIARIGRKINYVEGDLAGVAVDTISRIEGHWDEYLTDLADAEMRKRVDEHKRAMVPRLSSMTPRW